MGMKHLTTTNALAYLSGASATKKRPFLTSTPEWRNRTIGGKAPARQNGFGRPTWARTSTRSWRLGQFRPRSRSRPPWRSRRRSSKRG